MKRKLFGIFIAIISMVAMLLVTIFLKHTFSLKTYKKNQKSDLNKTYISDKNQTQILLKTTILEVQRAKIDNSIVTEIDDYLNSQKIEKKVSKDKKKIFKSSSCKAKNITKKVTKKVFHDNISRLAIIMDDIGSFNQVEKLKQIPYPITPSIFPSTKKHPNTPDMAKEFEHYMVHMPMEAYNFSREEENTLKVTDTLQMIDDRIVDIHKDFPNLIAINNHTGSKFTSDFEAMDRLFCVINKYNINFIDSKTARYTLGSKMAKLHNEIVFNRDVFLDNKPDIEYILKQIRKAIEVAKKKGVAIAICHPRIETFEALNEARYLFEDVKLVYIDELY